MTKTLLQIFAASVALVCSTASGANLTFSGGNSAPLSLTLLDSVSYTITGPSVSAPFFVFKDIGDVFPFTAVTGDIKFTINGGGLQTLAIVNSGVSASAVGINDLYMYGPLTGLAVGDIVILLPGTLTTSAIITDPAPANGWYTSFIVESNAVRISNDGVPVGVPEGGSSTILFSVAAAAVLFLRRRLAA